MIKSALLLLLAFQQTEPSYAEQSAAIVEKMELGFKLCAKHVVGQGILSAEHKEELAGLNVLLGETPPQDVQLMSTSIFPKDTFFAKIDGEGSNVWVVTSPETPACKVSISDTNAILKARLDFTGKLASTSSWSFDKSQSGTRGGIMREALILNSGLMMVVVDGPQALAEGGKDIQAIMTVILLTPPTAQPQEQK